MTMVFSPKEKALKQKDANAKDKIRPDKENERPLKDKVVLEDTLMTNLQSN